MSNDAALLMDDDTLDEELSGWGAPTSTVGGSDGVAATTAMWTPVTKAKTCEVLSMLGGVPKDTLASFANLEEVPDDTFRDMVRNTTNLNHWKAFSIPLFEQLFLDGGHAGGAMQHDRVETPSVELFGMLWMCVFCHEFAEQLATITAQDRTTMTFQSFPAFAAWLERNAQVPLQDQAISFRSMWLVLLAELLQITHRDYPAEMLVKTICDGWTEECRIIPLLWPSKTAGVLPRTYMTTFLGGIPSTGQSPKLFFHITPIPLWSTNDNVPHGGISQIPMFQHHFIHDVVHMYFIKENFLVFCFDRGYANPREVPVGYGGYTKLGNFEKPAKIKVDEEGFELDEDGDRVDEEDGPAVHFCEWSDLHRQRRFLETKWTLLAQQVFLEVCAFLQFLHVHENAQQTLSYLQFPHLFPSWSEYFVTKKMEFFFNIYDTMEILFMCRMLFRLRHVMVSLGLTTTQTFNRDFRLDFSAQDLFKSSLDTIHIYGKLASIVTTETNFPPEGYLDLKVLKEYMMRLAQGMTQANGGNPDPQTGLHFFELCHWETPSRKRKRSFEDDDGSTLSAGSRRRRRRRQLSSRRRSSAKRRSHRAGRRCRRTRRRRGKQPAFRRLR